MAELGRFSSGKPGAGSGPMISATPNKFLPCPLHSPPTKKFWLQGWLKLNVMLPFILWWFQSLHSKFRWPTFPVWKVLLVCCQCYWMWLFSIYDHDNVISHRGSGKSQVIVQYGLPWESQKMFHGNIKLRIVHWVKYKSHLQKIFINSTKDKRGKCSLGCFRNRK